MPFPSPEDLPDPGIEFESPAVQASEPQRCPHESVSPSRLSLLPGMLLLLLGSFFVFRALVFFIPDLVFSLQGPSK